MPSASWDGPHEPQRRGLAGRMVDAVVAPIVGPIVGAVDVAGVVDRVDVEGVVDRIDVDALIDRVDIDGLIGRVDVDGLIGRVDLDGLIGRVDVDGLIGRVDLDGLIDRVDVDRVIGRVDLNQVLDRVDLDRVVDRLDMNRVLGRVDLDSVIDRLDLNRLIDRVDVARIVERVDLDAVMARVDVNEIVRRTELGSVIARSTTGVFGELLDAARGVGVTVDLLVQGTVGRILRPGREQRPGRPGDPDDVAELRSLTAAERGVALQGHHAGSFSRFLAFLADQFLLGALFAAGQALLVLALELVVGVSWTPTDHRYVVAAAYAGWYFIYTAGLLALVGRTIGKAVAGLQVVRADGDRLDGRHAVVRTVMFPVSFFLFGIGLLIGLVRRDRRELHDLVADTAVIYAWDAELARLRARGQPVSIPPVSIPPVSIPPAGTAGD